MIKFIKSASKPSEYIVDDKPEICLIGRSNVGKSSLINALSNSKIAKTSSTPGRTQLVNFFDFGICRLVDLPGYGFAKLPRPKQEEIMKLTEKYFNSSKNLKTIVHIVDANVITDLDLEMSLYFRSLNKKNYILVLNKVDKEKMYRYQNNLHATRKFLQLDETTPIVLASAAKNINIKELNNIMIESVK